MDLLFRIPGRRSGHIPVSAAPTVSVTIVRFFEDFTWYLVVLSFMMGSEMKSPEAATCFVTLSSVLFRDWSSLAYTDRLPSHTYVVFDISALCIYLCITHSSNSCLDCKDGIDLVSILNVERSPSHNSSEPLVFLRPCVNADSNPNWYLSSFSCKLLICQCS